MEIEHNLKSLTPIVSKREVGLKGKKNAKNTYKNGLLVKVILEIASSSTINAI